MKPGMNRRNFVTAGAAAIAATSAINVNAAPATNQEKSKEAKPTPFKISLAEWSLHRAIYNEKTMTNLDFPKISKTEFGIDAIEYVNQFFKDKANDLRYLTDLKMRCDDHGVKSLLIMCDGEGNLGDPDEAARAKAVENHHKWLIAARFLGCHSIRVNAASAGTYEEQAKLAADGLSKLSELGAQYELNVIVENHGGLSSNGAWLAQVIKSTGMKNCGTLPDFGNFRVGTKNGKPEMYDRYKGVTELMPFAKAVSAKSHDFDKEGNETKTDYLKMMKIVLSAGYQGYVGIEFEGGGISEFDGIKATKKLLESVRDQIVKANG